MTSSGEAIAKRGILTLKYPIEKGLVVNWDDLEKLLHHTFYNELRVAPEEQPIIIGESPLNNNALREHIILIMFETFNVPELILIPTPLLVLQAHRISSGLVIDSGYGITTVTPVVNRKIIKQAIRSFNVGGSTVNEYLGKILMNKGNRIESQELLTLVKHSFCYISQDYEYDLELEDALFVKSFDSPDGSVFTIGKERFMAPEIIFNPSLCNLEQKGLIHQISDSISACPNEVQSELWNNIVLAGGNTCFPGMKKRLEKELKSLTLDVNVISPANRALSQWIGGSLMEDFGNNCRISLEEYGDEGPQIALRKLDYYV